VQPGEPARIARIGLDAIARSHRDEPRSDDVARASARAGTAPARSRSVPPVAAAHPRPARPRALDRLMVIGQRCARPAARPLSPPQSGPTRHERQPTSTVAGVPYVALPGPPRQPTQMRGRRRLSSTDRMEPPHTRLHPA
jgi:hypothetical protein